MARAPYSPVPDVEPSGPSPRVLDINATPASFGGLIGQGEQKLAAGLDEAGQNITQTAVNFQLRANQVATDAAFNKLQQSYFNMTFGDPNDLSKPGFYSLRGADAVAAYPKVANEMEATRSQIAQSLPNDAARLQFDQASRRLQMIQLDMAGRHYSTQFDAMGIADNQAKQKINLDAIGASYNNDAAYEFSLQEGLKGAVREAQTKYGMNASDDIINSAVHDYESKAIATRALAWGERGHDPAAALAFLQKNQSKVNSVTYDQVEARLKGVATSASVADGINVVTGGGGAAASSSSGTPWIENRSDSNTPGQGTLTSQYVDKVMARYRQNGGNIYDAIENGGERSPQSAVSPKGAVGVGQIMPATWAKYARPGENINNEADNRAVEHRIIDDLSRQFNGDPQRIAVGYFSGPDNVSKVSAEQAASSKPYVVGDSIGAGVRMAGRMDGTVETGAAPDAILRGINNLSPDAIKGRDIVLSSGASNNPQQVNMLADQIAALKAKGAGNITVLGVGTRPDLAGVNEKLAQIAQQNGATFAGPLRNVGPDQIHPVNYGPIVASLTQGALPASGAQPHDPTTYGQEAQMMARARAEADRRFPNDPVAHKALVDGVWNELQQTNVLQAKYEAEQAKQQRDAQEAAGQTVVKQLMTDPSKFDPAIIRDNPALSYTQKEALWKLAESHLAKGADDHDVKTYGSGFYDLYQKIHAPAGDPNRITDPSQLWGHVGPNGDLTVSGVDKLTQEIQGRRTPEGEAEGEMKKVFLANARNQIAGTNDLLHLRDPKGEELYLKFLAHALPAYDEGRRNGKSAAQLLDPDSKDYIGASIGQFKRDPATFMQDMISANKAPELTTPTAPAPAPLNTADDVAAALKSGRIDYVAAAQRLRELGFQHRVTPPPSVPQSIVPTNE